MKATYHVRSVRVPRVVFEYLCLDRQTCILCDLLAWVCAGIGAVFLTLARWHLETGFRLAGGPPRLLHHLEHDPYE